MKAASTASDRVKQQAAANSQSHRGTEVGNQVREEQKLSHALLKKIFS